MAKIWTRKKKSQSLNLKTCTATAKIKASNGWKRM